MNDDLKNRIKNLKSRLGSGDIARIADKLEGHMLRTDVYNIMNGKSLKDLYRVKAVIETGEEIAENRKAILG